MKKTQNYNIPNSEEDGLLVEYDFDYRKAKPNRFANQPEQHPVIITLDSDVAEVFKSSEVDSERSRTAVNHALRALLSAIPRGT